MLRPGGREPLRGHMALPHKHRCRRLPPWLSTAGRDGAWLAQGGRGGRRLCRWRVCARRRPRRHHGAELRPAALGAADADRRPTDSFRAVCPRPGRLSRQRQPDRCCGQIPTATVNATGAPQKLVLHEVSQSSGEEVEVRDELPTVLGLQISLDAAEARLFLLGAKKKP